MKRPIEFRAWDVRQKKYKYPKLWDNSMPSNWEQHYILEQYAGLTDRNGVKVYEGDIFHMGDTNITYTVVWCYTGLMGKQNGGSSYVGLEYWIGLITVTGNIHEKQP